jgi:hypothetical protein
MFLTAIPFKGCQGHSNRSSIVHAVSYFACAVSMAPHALFEDVRNFYCLFDCLPTVVRKEMRTVLTEDEDEET